MKKFEATMALEHMLLQKQADQLEEKKLLLEQAYLTGISLKPINIIRSTVDEVISSPDLKTKVVGAAITLLAGFIVKKVLNGNSSHILTKISSLILETAMAKIDTKDTSRLDLATNDLPNVTEDQSRVLREK